jgi:pimeloyl-ACP methyl ester carboxylesterase
VRTFFETGTLASIASGIVRIWIAAVAAAVFALALAVLSALQPATTTAILRTNPPTPYFHSSSASPSRGRTLVVHGLDASKNTMRIISAALADADFDVYSIDLPGHGDSTAGFDANVAREVVRQAVAEINPSIVVGHSLGAGLLLDVADDQRFSTMVLLSPPPVPIRDIQADRVLLITGAYDVGRIRAFAPILKDVGYPRIDWWNLSWAGHSSAIISPEHIGRIIHWIGGPAEKTQTTKRLVAVTAILISVVVLGVTLLPGRPINATQVSIPVTLVRFIAACSLAVVSLRFFVPLGWLRLFATDYLISFLFLTGVILWTLSPQRPHPKAINVLKAIVAAAFVVGLMGFFGASYVLNMSLADGRWWRFLSIVPAGLPLFLFDEMTLRKIGPAWRSIGTTIVTKGLLWAFLIAGVLLLNREAAFLVLIAHLMVFFWIALWFAAHVVHRHTQDPFAAALFAALIQGWAFAAWFVIR